MDIRFYNYTERIRILVADEYHVLRKIKLCLSIKGQGKKIHQARTNENKRHRIHKLPFARE